MKKGRMEETREIMMNFKEIIKEKLANKTWADKQIEKKETLKMKEIRKNLDQEIMKEVKEDLKRDLGYKEKGIKVVLKEIKIKMMKD